MSESTESYEEHVLQNNNRLQSLGQCLRDVATFESACIELTQWCSDPRAYTTHFEENLLIALQNCAENGTKEGFDFALAHQLITCCFQHRKLLSKESAVRINRWYEQYRRIKKNGGKRKRKQEVPPVDPGGFEQITVTDSGTTAPMWPQGGPMAGATPMQSPGYQPMMPMPGTYPGMQPSPFPMDPTGARPGYPEHGGHYDPQAMHIQQQRMMMMQQQMAMQQQQRRRQAAMAAGGYDPSAMYNGIPMGANSVPGQSQPLLRMPSQNSMTSPAYASGMGIPASASNGGGRQPMPSPAYPQGNPQMIRAGPPMLFGQLQQNTQHQQVMSYPNPHASNGQIPPFPGQLEFLIIPIGHPPLLSQFMIHPDQTTYSAQFEVSAELYQQLSSTQHMNLQLKSYDQNNPQFKTTWPQKDEHIAIHVAINGQQIPVRSESSILIKNLVKMGQNTIQMMVGQAGFRNCFILQVVNVLPTVKVVEDLFQNQQRRGVTAEISKQRLMQRANASGGTVSIPFNDPKTGRRLRQPARSIKCDHAACFDLQTTLQDQFECARLLCPVIGCNTVFLMQEVEIDEFIGGVLRESQTRNPPATEVVVDATGAYRVVDAAEPSTSTTASSRKRGADDSTGSFPMKRIKSEQFPMPPTSSSPFPTINSLPCGIGQSPMMSPFAAHISPKKEIHSPAPAKIQGGPGTPKDEPVATTTTPGAPLLSSPHPQPITQHGSVEAPSLTGSAPYTPASMNGVPPQNPPPQDQQTATTTMATTQHNASFSSLDIEDLLVTTQEGNNEKKFQTTMSTEDIRRYLLDTDSLCVKDSQVSDMDLWSEQTLQDIRDVISADLAKTALNA